MENTRFSEFLSAGSLTRRKLEGQGSDVLFAPLPDVIRTLACVVYASCGIVLGEKRGD